MTIHFRSRTPRLNDETTRFTSTRVVENTTDLPR